MKIYGQLKYTPAMRKVVFSHEEIGKGLISILFGEGNKALKFIEYINILRKKFKTMPVRIKYNFKEIQKSKEMNDWDAIKALVVKTNR